MDSQKVNQKKLAVDSYSRRIDYVRIAVTDRCNLRCHYCMPAHGIRYAKKHNLLTISEIVLLLRALASIGFRKVRFTGGEPFVRHGIFDLLRQTVKIPEYQSIHITSNGTLLQPNLSLLKSLGILDINLSLDTLDEKRFFKITRRNDFHKVMNVLEQMMAHGFRVKINAVIMEGMNEGDIVSLAMLTKEYPLEVRFIEEMPFNGSGKFSRKITFNKPRIQSELQKQFDLQQLPMQPGATTTEYSILGHVGKVGIIAAFTRTFCDTCNRLRITATGDIKNCLYDSGVFNVRDYLRDGAGQDEVAQKICEIIFRKPENGFVAERQRRHATNKAESMSSIGG